MSYQLIRASAHNTGLPDKSVHCVVTSPPYYGLRAYAGEQMIEWPTVRYSPMPGLPELTIQGCEPGCAHEWGEQLLQREQSGRSRLKWETGGQPAAKVPDGPVSQGAYCIHCGGWRGGLGNEPTPEAFIGHLILVMREMWRVLRDDGCAWVNLGDSYNGSGKGPTGVNGIGNQTTRQGFDSPKRILQDGLKPKDLMMIPARFALAAQADGWYLRSDVIWHKPNPMPESVTDRPTKAHEYIYLLAKSEKYFYDCEAVREAASQSSIDRINQPNFANQTGGPKDYATTGINPNRSMRKTLEHFAANPGRNRRSVWTVATSPYSGAHFATWPQALVEPMIKAGTSAYGVCPQCQAPWVRVTEKTGGDTEAYERPKKTAGMTSKTSTLSLSENGSKEWAERGAKVTTTGWQPSCACDAGEPIPATVLDPFNGSGTSGRVALQLGRSYIGVDISEEYLSDLAPERLSNVQMVMSL